MSSGSNQKYRLIRLSFRTLGRIAPRTAGRVAYGLFCTPRGSPAIEAEQRILDRAQCLRIAVPDDAEGHVVVYRWCDAGDADSRPGVLLAHGWGSRAARLTAWVEPLRAAGFEVLAFDAPAHGASSGKSTNLVACAKAMRAVAAQVSSLHAIVGHSFGGMSAAMAVAGGELFRSGPLTPSRLVLIASPNRSRDVIAGFARLLDVPPAAVAEMHREIERRASHPVDAFAVSRVLAGWSGPVLVVHDRDDEQVPFSDAEAIAAAAPGATLAASAGLGHRRVARDGRIIAQVLEFLQTGHVSPIGDTPREEFP